MTYPRNTDDSLIDIEADVQRASERINAAWRKGVESIFEVGKLLASYRDKWIKTPGKWSRLIGDNQWRGQGLLMFSKSHVYRLIRIAECERLLPHVGVLPSDTYALDHLVSLPSDVFDEKIADSSITPELKRSEINLWLARSKRRARYGDLLTAPLPVDAPVHILYVDPPWRYENPPMGDSGRSIENHYPTMILDEIRNLDIGACALSDAMLFMWATAPKLAECMTLFEPWGFEYRTNLIWDKIDIGMGYYARNQHELLLIGKRGVIPLPDEELRPPSVYREKSGLHSRKPIYYYALIERWYPNLRKREFFSRDVARPGWLEPWGNQVPVAA